MPKMFPISLVSLNFNQLIFFANLPSYQALLPLCDLLLSLALKLARPWLPRRYERELLIHCFQISYQPCVPQRIFFFHLTPLHALDLLLKLFSEELRSRQSDGMTSPGNKRVKH